MFEKFKNEDTDPEIPVTPKPQIKTFEQQIPAEVPKVDSSNDAEAIIKAINENPGKPAIFENCTGSTFNQVYKMCGRIKPTWDETKKVIKYKQ
tara:strand:+ start:322 stop:600 length:279 start_codon:yes stop_codon:yes gene_type:complete